MRALHKRISFIAVSLVQVACGTGGALDAEVTPVPSPAQAASAAPSPTSSLPPTVAPAPTVPDDRPNEPPLESPYREDVERLVRGKWSALPIPPGSCAEAVAEDPAASVPALTWSACPGGPAGWSCTLADWATAQYVDDALAVMSQDPVVRGGAPQFVIRRTYRWSHGAVARLDAIQSLTGPALYARLRGHRGELCWGHLNISTTGIADNVLVDGGLGGQGHLLLWSLWSVPRLYEHRWFYPRDFTYQGLDDVYLGPDDLFVAGSFPRDTVFIELRTGYAGTKVYPNTTWTTEKPVPYDQGVIAISRAQGEKMALFFHTRSERWFIERARDGLDMVELRVDRAKDEVVWTERQALPTPILEYGAGVMRVARKDFLGGFTFETEFPIPASKPHSGFVVNGGVAVLVDKNGDALVLRTTDGKGWRIPQLPGLTTLSPVWVDDEFVWLGVSPPREYGPPVLSGIARIDRKTLGEPGDVYKAE